MQITVTGQHLEITPALKKYANNKFEKIGKHFDHVTSTHVVLHVEKTRHLAEATLTTKGATLHAQAQADSMYASIDALADKMDRQVIKHKEKLRDHHQQGGALKQQGYQ